MKKEDLGARAQAKFDLEQELRYQELLEGQKQVEAQRRNLVALLPDAIKAIASCIRKPGRNSQTQLAAAKTVLDRAGLPIIAATEIRPPAGQEALQISVRFVDPPKEGKK